MKTRIAILALAFLGLSTAATGADELRTKMKIAVVDDESNEEIRFELDSDELGFNLHDMQEGESRSIVDATGKAILITREADGFKLDVDGKTVTLPQLHHGHHGPLLMQGDGVDDVDVHVVRRGGGRMPHDMDGIMVMSGEPIDEATQQAIRALLESSGNGGEVRFIDRKGGPGGPHRIKIIEKKLDAAN